MRTPEIGHLTFSLILTVINRALEDTRVDDCGWENPLVAEALALVKMLREQPYALFVEKPQNEHSG